MIGKQRKDFFRQEVPYREATKAPAGQQAFIVKTTLMLRENNEKNGVLSRDCSNVLLKTQFQ